MSAQPSYLDQFFSIDIRTLGTRLAKGAGINFDASITAAIDPNTGLVNVGVTGGGGGALVPVTRTIAGTSPVRINGGASADLSNTVTVSLDPAATVTAGVVSIGQKDVSSLATLAATDVAVTGAADNGSGKVRLTAAGHGLIGSGFVLVTAVGGTVEANGTHGATAIDSSHVDLTAVPFSNAYTSGGGLGVYQNILPVGVPVRSKVHLILKSLMVRRRGSTAGNDATGLFAGYVSAARGDGAAELTTGGSSAIDLPVEFDASFFGSVASNNVVAMVCASRNGGGATYDWLLAYEAVVHATS